jgi:hypothetical protein
VPTTFETKKETTGFGFDGNFANFDAFNDPAPTNGTKTDAWGSSSRDKSNNNVGRVKKYNEKGEPKNGKFSADYSDNFDDDLAQVLKRSVIEQ